MKSVFFAPLLSLYFPLLVFLASRIPIEGDRRPSWTLWIIGLSLAGLGVGALVAGIYVLSALAGTTGRIADIVAARDAMLHSGITFVLVGYLLAPSALSLVLLAGDGYSARLVPDATVRHWIYFALIFAALAIAGGLMRPVLLSLMPA